MKLIIGLFIFCVCGPFAAQALELRQIRFAEKSIDLEFMDRGRIVTLRDEAGWVTLRTLSLLAFQDQVEESYQNPKLTERILRTESPHLSGLTPAFSKALAFLKSRTKASEPSDLISGLFETEIFNPSVARNRNSESVLVTQLAPLLEMEPKQDTMKLIEGKTSSEIPRWSLDPKDSISFALSASQLRIPATSKFRTPSRIDWDPAKFKIVSAK